MKNKAKIDQIFQKPWKFIKFKKFTKKILKILKNHKFMEKILNFWKNHGNSKSSGKKDQNFWKMTRIVQIQKSSKKTQKKNIKQKNFHKTKNIKHQKQNR